MLCSDCSRQFKTPGGLARHRQAAHPAPVSKLYFYASDVSVELNGQTVASFKEISYDSTKDKAPRVTEGVTLKGFKLVDALGVLEKIR